MDTLLIETLLSSKMSAKKQRKAIKMFSKRNTVKCWWHRWNQTMITDKKYRKIKRLSKGTQSLTTYLTQYVDRRSIKLILVFKYRHKSQKVERLIQTNNMIKEKKLLLIYRILSYRLHKIILEIRALSISLKNLPIQTQKMNHHMKVKLRQIKKLKKSQ